MKTWANILLGTWLVLTGMLRLGGVSLPKCGSIVALLGIVTGILFFVASSGEKIGTQIGGILPGTWLVAGSLVSLFNVRFTGSSVILAVLGVSDGVMVLITRRQRFMRKIVRDWTVRGQAWLVDLPQGSLPDHSSLT